MADYGIDVFDFVSWQGPAPAIAQEHVIARNRAGADGVSLQLLGEWGEPFEVTCTSHHTSMLAAIDAYRLMVNVVGTGWLYVKYGSINYTNLYQTGYHATKCDQVSLNTAVLIAGPGYNYTNGGILVTRWMLQPEAI